MHCDQTCTVICCLHTHQQYAKRVMAWHVTIATSKRPFAKPSVPSVLWVMPILSRRLPQVPVMPAGRGLQQAAVTAAGHRVMQQQACSAVVRAWKCS